MNKESRARNGSKQPKAHEPAVLVNKKAFEMNRMMQVSSCQLGSQTPSACPALRNSNLDFRRADGRAVCQHDLLQGGWARAPWCLQPGPPLHLIVLCTSNNRSSNQGDPRQHNTAKQLHTGLQRQHKQHANAVGLPACTPAPHNAPSLRIVCVQAWRASVTRLLTRMQ